MPEIAITSKTSAVKGRGGGAELAGVAKPWPAALGAPVVLLLVLL